MDSALFIFIIFGVWVIIDPGNICDIPRGVSNANNTWQLQYISEKIAQCKDDGFDPAYFREWLAWISVAFFPFLMIQFQLIYNTIVREIIIYREAIESDEEEVINPRTRATRAGKPHTNTDSNQVSTSKAEPVALEGGLLWTLTKLVVMLLECFCVGGFFWLVFYIHTGPYRWWHAVATVILFVSATILNIILCVIYTVYKHETAKRIYWHKLSAIYLLMLLQVASVISFIWAFALQQDKDPGEQDVAITLEYIVAVIWFMTIVLDCVLYYSIRVPEHSSPLSQWSLKIMKYYAGFTLVGIGVVRGILDRFPKT
tara:strand:- start:11982 stop:12923 length:942 start_codon:yes stop_codon:yes gene_type:complete